MKSLRILIVTALILATALSGGALAAGSRSIPQKDAATLTLDGVQTLTGQAADLRQALQEASVVRYKLVVIDDTAREDREAYLDRVLAEWGWPAHDQLLLIVFAEGNHDIRFAMGSDFRKNGVTVSEMVGLLRGVYYPAVRAGDPAHALAELIRAVNKRMWPEKGMGPEQVVRAFYFWRMGNVSPTAEKVLGTVIHDRLYRTSPYVTPAFVTRMDETLAKMEQSNGGFDPFLCAQDLPYDLTFEPATIEGSAAKLYVWTHFSTNQSIRVDLKQTDGRWLIDQITCPAR